MSYVIRDIYSLPITIPDVSADGPGVMTPEMLAELEAVAPAAWVAWSTLGFFDGFGSAVAPFGVAQSRVAGDTVELSGIVIAPPGGTGGNYHVTNLPADQRPSAIRILATCYQVGSNPATAILVQIDDDAGSATGVPGAVTIGDANNEIPAGGALVFLDGLSFAL